MLPPAPHRGASPVLVAATAWNGGVRVPPCAVSVCSATCPPVPAPAIYYRVLVMGRAGAGPPLPPLLVVTSPPVLNKVRVGASVWVQVCPRQGGRSPRLSLVFLELAHCDLHLHKVRGRALRR